MGCTTNRIRNKTWLREKTRTVKIGVVTAAVSYFFGMDVSSGRIGLVAEGTGLGTSFIRWGYKTIITKHPKRPHLTIKHILKL